MHTTRYGLAGTWLLAVFCWFAVADEASPSKKERSTRESSFGASDMLQRFVDELILVTPGRSPFPKSLRVGGRSLAPGIAFRVAAYETTQELYQLVEGENPSRWRGPRNSVESMTHADAERFCAKLTLLLRDAQLIEATSVVRLPTDVEWEYSCRAGSIETYSFGSGKSAELLEQYAWYAGNAAGNDPAVGELMPNDYGLYDVHGYLWEFVNEQKSSGDALPDVGAANMAMGGSWKDKAPRLACDSRVSVPADGRSDAIGFRCVVSEQESDSRKTPDQ